MSVNIRVKQRLQAALKQQSNGLLGLANLFKEYDTDNSGALNWEEFCTALQKCGLTPSPQDIRALFLELDKDGNNEISYEEFIQAMRGDLSNPRKALITRVFESIDSDNDGVISMTDIGKCFNPKNHPDVRSGRKTVQVLIQEFFDTFGTVSNTGFISLDQFIEYYANTAAFDDDAKFNEMMKSLWTIRTAPNSVSSLKSFTNAHQSNIGTLLTEADPGTTKNLDQLREQLISRGARGIVGLQRKFRIIDDDGSKTINLVEFKKAMKECGLALTELQMNSLFSLFDKDRNGSIDFNEFITGIRVSSHLLFVVISCVLRHLRRAI
jgi:Ca2+-binding EF-hand superfamily protein